MSKLGALTRAGLKSNFGIGVFCHRIFKEKKDRWFLPILGFSLLGFGSMLYGFIAFLKSTYFVLKPIGQESALLALGVVAGQVLILIFGIYYVLAAFYFSRDLEMLIPLPLRASEVLLSKFIIIAINEYLTIAVIVLPFLITFGVLDGRGLGYWAISALVYLALPLIPLAIVSVVVVVMMRFINVSRKKDILILVGGIAVLAAVFGFQFLVQQSANSKGMTAESMAAFLTSPDSLLTSIGSVFPPAIWAAKALSGGLSGRGLLNLAAFLGASVLSFGAIIVLGEHLFYRGVIGLSETSGRKQVLTQDQLSRRVSSGRRAVPAIFLRELRLMNRTPVFLLNGVLVVLFLPALLLFLFRADPKSPGAGLQKLIESGNFLLVVLFAALFMIICSSLNGTASSTFSREGVQFWISRVIPVAPREQVAAKFLHSYLVGLLGTVTAAVGLRVLLPLSLLHLLLAIGLSLVTTALMTVVGMLIDLARPLLDWTNPQKAIKQNLNVLLATFADMAILAAAVFGLKALIKANVAANTILFLLFIVLIFAVAFSYLALLKFADKRYQEIES